MGVDADGPQLGQDRAQAFDSSAHRAARADRTDQAVDGTERSEQLLGEQRICPGVFRIVVLGGTESVLRARDNRRQAVEPGLLDAAGPVQGGTADDVDRAAEILDPAPQRGVHHRIGDHVKVHPSQLAHHRECQAEGSRARLHNGGATGCQLPGPDGLIDDEARGNQFHQEE